MYNTTHVQRLFFTEGQLFCRGGKIMKKVLSLVLALLMVLSLTACGASGKADSNVIKIGVFEPSSGDSASGGKKEILGMQYANSLTPRSSWAAKPTKSNWFTAITVLLPIKLLPLLLLWSAQAYPLFWVPTVPAFPWQAAPNSKRPVWQPSA